MSNVRERNRVRLRVRGCATAYFGENGDATVPRGSDYRNNPVTQTRVFLDRKSRTKYG